jgi:hypothetical protein
MTISPDWNKTCDPHTWGFFFKYAKEFGVEIREDTFRDQNGNPADILYFYRFDPQKREDLYSPIPPDRTPHRHMGFGRMARVCSRLRIPEPADWPVDF